MITEFTGFNAYLSTLSKAEVTFSDLHYPTVENAFQASRFYDDQRYAFTSCSPYMAVREARRAKFNQEWEDNKIEIMRSLLAQKFLYGSVNAKRLLKTKDVELINGSVFDDTYWGVCNGTGMNMLGKLLMEVRTGLRNQKKNQRFINALKKVIKIRKKTEQRIPALGQPRPKAA